ncbi:PAS domain-containing protein [Rhizobium sp. YIM 134829]|uniref:PAS domain-containing protein n=1 Tax=Rhizobium sp. YIM 134829 TaxID=3390453 RepID=UPI00397D08E2
MGHHRSSALLDRLLVWSLAHPIKPLHGVAAVVAAVLVVSLIRVFLITSVAPWMLFIPAIVAAGLLIGREAAIIASLLSVIAASLTLGRLENPSWMTVPQWLGTLLFLCITLVLGLVAAELRFAFARQTQLAEENARTSQALRERESFLASILASSTDCIEVVDLDGTIRFMSEGGLRTMQIDDPSAIVGRPWLDFWSPSEREKAGVALARALEGQSTQIIGQAPTMTGTLRWWDAAITPILGADQRTERILSVSRDITPSRADEAERRRLSRIVETTTDFIALADAAGTVFFLNDAALELVGLERSVLGTIRLEDFFAPEEGGLLQAELLRSVESEGSWSGERLFRHFATGETIPVLCTLFPVTASDGTLIGYGTVTRDYRDQKRMEAQQKLLNDELSHRLKNVLSVVQSVAAQTLRQADDLGSASQALSARLVALGEATAVLTASSWSSAGLEAMIHSVLGHHGTIGERFRLSGPPLTLRANGALAFALALHELATNASKYGALSCESGHVSLSWSITENGPEARRLHLVWQEIGGPKVSPPSRRGFGSTMIERSLQAYFEGETRLDYHADGLIFEIDCPLDAAAMLA